MKKIYFLLLLQFSCFSVISQVKVSVTVHPGTELLSVVQLLAEDSSDLPSTYQQEVLAFFKPFKQHEAVKKAKALPFINCDFPMRHSWAFYNFPNPRLFEPAGFGAYDKYFKREQVLDYFKACIQFFYDTGFWRFYQDHTAEYTAWVQSFNRNLYEEKMLAIIDSFYRTSPDKEVVFTLGALNCNSYSLPDMKPINPAFANNMVIMMAYGNLALKKVTTATQPDFYAPAWATQLVWHEVGHVFLAPMFENCQKQVEALKYIYDNDTAIQKKAGKLEWSRFLNENVTQAVTSLLRIHVKGIQGAKEINRIKEYYCFVPVLIDIIEQEYYGKTTYKNFEEFFPVLLQLLGERYVQH